MEPREAAALLLAASRLLDSVRARGGGGAAYAAASYEVEAALWRLGEQFGGLAAHAPDARPLVEPAQSEAPLG